MTVWQAAEPHQYIRLVCDRMLIVSTRPVEELHEAAKEMRLRRSAFDDTDPRFPSYRLPLSKHARLGELMERFGPITVGHDKGIAVLAECDRKKS